MRHYSRLMRFGRSCFGAMVVVLGWGVSYPALSAERLYCFSDICPGDPPSILNGVTLNELSDLTDRKPPAIELKAALPETRDADRKTLAKRIGLDGRFLLDKKTLQIFLGIKQVCAPMAPFVAFFTSESGHLTAVEFDVVKVGDEVRFGVKTIARVFRIKPATPEHLALLADLSQKFGFKIDSQNPHGAPDGLVASFDNGEQSFRLSFALPELASRGIDIAAQPACAPLNRIGID